MRSKAETLPWSCNVLWLLCRVSHIYVHLHISHDFTAATNAQSLKQRVKLYTTLVFWSVFLICVFDLSILFEALSSSFPPHFNKDKTESRIVAAKSLSHENMKSFMSSVEWKIKLIYFSLQISDNIACLNAFSLLLHVCVEGVPAWPRACTCVLWWIYDVTQVRFLPLPTSRTNTCNMYLVSGMSTRDKLDRNRPECAKAIQLGALRGLEQLITKCKSPWSR